MIVAVSGPIGSGKDTVAKYFREKYGFEHHSFAHKLRQICSLLTNLPIETFETREGKASIIKFNNTSMTVGQFLQKVGNGLRELVTPDIWCTALLSGYKGQKWVISDLRYPNEMEEVRKRGGICIRLEGDPAKIRERNEDGRDLQAPSETALHFAKFDWIVSNSSSLEDLYLILDNIIAVHGQ